MLSIILEIVSSCIEMPEWLWRILCFRYVLLIWLGYDVVTNGIRISFKLLVLSIFSMAFISLMYYIHPNLSPLFIYNGWKIEHWPAYFYPTYLLLWLIRKMYDEIPERIKYMISAMRRASYEIFLLQMFCFALLTPTRINVFEIQRYNFLLFLFFAWTFSVGGGILWKKLNNASKNNSRIKKQS